MNHYVKLARKSSVYLLATIGAFALLLFISGLILDLRSFDETKGGYEPPFENFTGEPINFNELDQSAEGIVGRGYTVNILLNCTTGMVTFEFFKLRFDVLTVSERAIAVHKPQDACIKRGFDPQFLS
ncbi:hypothetical protein [Geomicrobium sediminis]|uniref:Uncharacterized protein n=1 Tax=Geomicrobium sediminis TaxID=1347788 RepID=A0ABS2PA04_9BACL|nr:hypothetical protein [Geomicrobium sediminis]MBM7632186.1 hypothetical protein [Geomicrobium sediminis]